MRIGLVGRNATIGGVAVNLRLRDTSRTANLRHAQTAVRDLTRDGAIGDAEKLGNGTDVEERIPFTHDGVTYVPPR